MKKDDRLLRYKIIKGGEDSILLFKYATETKQTGRHYKVNQYRWWKKYILLVIADQDDK